jgi:RNA polymerase sigma factor (sigma-70 family)
MNIQPELISNCIKRERKAEYEMYKNTYSYLMSICIRYTRNEERAKEALNTGFLKILNHLDRYKPEIPFKVWIRRIMINTLIDDFRKQKKHHSKIEYVEDYRESSDFSESNMALQNINAAQIHKLIEQLPPQSQQVFNLYVIDGYTHKEIGELMGISEGTSKWHLNASRQKLKEMLGNLVSPANMA